jgi:hypothetical protein
MANIEDALYARLTAVSAVTSLVSTRIYPVKKDTGATVVWPFVTYSTVLSERSRAMVSDTGYVESSVRFHIWTKGASAFSSGGAISTAIRGALQRWSGTSAGVVVDQVFLDGEFDIEDSEPGVYHRVLDFDARWYE